MTAETTAVRLTPLYAVTERLGARWVELAGWRLAEAYAGPQAEMAAARAGCGLADVSPHGKLQIEGARAAEALAAAFGAAPREIGAHQATELGGLYRLRADLFYLSTRPGGETAARERLEAAVRASGQLVTVTDVTHGLCDIRLIGPRARDVLVTVCGLDFSDRAFPNHTARQTSVAKTKQLVIRRDFGPLPAYTLAGARSFGAYLWGVLMEAGRAHGIRPIGVAALRELESA